jgi:putative transposase
MRNITFAKNNFYHIYNRGVDKRSIFQNDNDKWRFLQGLFLFNDENNTSNILWQLEKKRGGVTFGVIRDFIADKGDKRNHLVNIVADCLMPNHFHFILEEIKENGISRFMHKLGTGYTKYFNQKYERSGSLFQGVFKAVPIEDDDYLKHLLVYINVINPAEMVKYSSDNPKERLKEAIKFIENYPWSTHQEYLGKRESLIINKSLLGKIFADTKYYKEFAEDILENRNFDLINHLTLE